MTRKSLVTFVSVVMAASLPFASAAQAGKKTAIGLGVLGAAVVLGAAAQASKNQQRAKARARAKAKARHRAKARAAAKKKAAYAAKKKAAQRRAIAAKKKKAAQQRAYAAKKAKQQKVAATEAKAREEAQAQAKADAEKTEGSFVSAPSTAALLTSKDVTEDAEPKTNSGDATEVAVVNEDDTGETTTDATPVVENTENGEGGCKRFIPAVGLTVSVGC